jgi:hypothetical protein
MTSVAEVTKLAGGGAVEVKTVGGETPYHYIFYKESGHLLTENFKSNLLHGLKPGKYFCMVIDKKNCRNTIEIEVK